MSDLTTEDWDRIEEALQALANKRATFYSRRGKGMAREAVRPIEETMARVQELRTADCRCDPPEWYPHPECDEHHSPEQAIAPRD